jgi:hypothetical protein
MPDDWADRAIMFSVIALVAWAIVVLPFLDYPWRETPQNKQGTAQGEQKTDSVGNQPPSFAPLKLLIPWR